MKNKDQKIDAVVLFSWIALLGIGILMGFVCLHYFVDKQKNVLELEIPQSTIDWFDGLVDGDFGGILDTTSIQDPDSYENVDSMLCLQDEYFMIYYSRTDSVKEYEKALIAQRYAHQAIPKAEKLMGNYPYPETINGRKLPIYLANTKIDYANINKKMGGNDGTGSVGMYWFSYSLKGTFTKGIVISPEAWGKSDGILDRDAEDNDFKIVLWHEMNHFMYFTNWDFTQTSEPCLWFTEGLAEYFANNSGRLNYVGNHSKYRLTNDVRDGNEYWVGLSAYFCLEDHYGQKNCYDMVVQSYDHSIEEAINMTMGVNLASWNNQWHTYMSNKEYRTHMRP